MGSYREHSSACVQRCDDLKLGLGFHNPTCALLAPGFPLSTFPPLRRRSPCHLLRLPESDVPVKPQQLVEEPLTQPATRACTDRQTAADDRHLDVINHDPPAPNPGPHICLHAPMHACSMYCTVLYCTCNYLAARTYLLAPPAV
ncbi:uncharacterized protein BKA78DRAFT_75605 [Phyllosticta capitalensis]|uniref:uncharacterized protein n=1 Tax=Phyllosticta capitalensis TaxID=121624 RepID=UPI0031316026